MKKDILLAVISEVIERGGSISIHMPQYNEQKPLFHNAVTEKEALQFAQTVADALGTEVEETDDTGSVKGVHTFKTRTDQVSFYASYHKFIEEDIDLTGSDFDDREAL